MSHTDNATQTIDPEITKAFKSINNVMLKTYGQCTRSDNLKNMPTAQEISTLVFNLLNLFEIFLDLYWQLPVELYGGFGIINAQAGFIRLLWADDAALYLLDGVAPKIAPYLKKRYQDIETREIGDNLSTQDILDNVTYAVSVFAGVWEKSALSALDYPSDRGDFHIRLMKDILLASVVVLKRFFDKLAN